VFNVKKLVTDSTKEWLKTGHCQVVLVKLM